MQNIKHLPLHGSQWSKTLGDVGTRVVMWQYGDISEFTVMFVLDRSGNLWNIWL